MMRGDAVVLVRDQVIFGAGYGCYIPAGSRGVVEFVTGDGMLAVRFLDFGMTVCVERASLQLDEVVTASWRGEGI